jgi:ABC-type branched-subunit amino acid transport system substrate-binding protein
MQTWGWQVVATETYSIRSTEFSAQILKLAEAKPDFILIALDDGKAPIALPALDRAGVRSPVINYPSGNAEAVFKTIASPQFLAVREFVDSSEPGEATKVMRDAATTYGTTGQMIGGAFTKGWVAARVIAAGLESCGDDCSGEKVKTALDHMSSFDTAGLGPTLSFAPDKKIGTSAGRLYQWSSKDGRAIPITDFIPTSR